MIKSSLKIAFRSFSRYRSYTLINIAGLAIGMACFILISLWVQDELSYNATHERADNIYRINKKYQIGTEVGYNFATPYPLASVIRMEIADVSDATTYHSARSLVKSGDQIVSRERTCYTDSSFFRIFTFQFIKGSAETALTDPHSLLITAALAQKYFGSDDPIGKILTINNRYEFSVAGVINEMPQNSDLRFDIFLPISSIIDSDDEQNWGSHWLRTYALLNENADPAQVENRLSSLIKERLPDEDISLVLQPLSHIHLYSVAGEAVGWKYVYFFTAIAAFVLLIACINYVNLSTALASRRAKEVALHKTIGATRGQIAWHFLGESILLSFMAMIVAIIIVELCRPAFNNLTGKNIETTFFDLNMGLSLLAIAVISGLLSGTYPAFFLSGFQPARTLKGTHFRSFSDKSLRKILVMVQFSLSIILIIGTIVIYAQLNYIKSKDLGYDKENVVCLSMTRDLRDDYTAFKNELLGNSGVLKVARSSELPTEIWSIMRGIVWEGKETDEGAAFGVASIDYDFIDLMNIEVTAGRSFSEEYGTDSINYIFNQKAIDIMGLENPINKRFFLGSEDNGAIVGVVQDFHFLPMTYEMEPLMFVMDPENYRELLIKISSSDISNTLEYIESVWKQFTPAYPFEFLFLDESFDSIYRDEQRAGNLFKYFVLLAILISCIGLSGLASYAVEQKTKEIGIRKVLGATAQSIVLMISREFMLLILLSCVIAFPAAWYIMDKWLQNFAYKTGIYLWMFAAGGAFALIIALLTVGLQTVKAALADPVRSLRCE